MRRALVVVLVSLAASWAALAETDLPRVAGEAVFVMREGRATQAWPAHPGEVVGIALEWPAGTRPENPTLADVDSELPGGLVPLRFVAEDPRAEGRDVLEVLPAALGDAALRSLTLTDSRGEPRALLEGFELPVTAALPEGDDDAAPARDPVALGLDPLGLVLLVLALAAALALVVRGWRRWRRTSPGDEDASVASRRRLSPRERALEAIAALLESGVHRRGDSKAFCVLVAEIGKDFYAGTHRVPLREHTSAECAQLLRRAGCSEDSISWLVGWLRRIDLVKFAGAELREGDMEALALALRARIDAEPAPLPGDPAEPALEAGR